MKVGLVIGDYAWQGGPARIADTLVEIGQSADDAGFSLIGAGDHLWQGPHAGGPESPFLECFTALSVLAAHTRRVRLAPVVAGVHFRQPGLLAKTVTSLDVLSKGRAMLGLGVGWYEDEAVGMGIGYPSLAARFEMLEETVQICHRLWDGEQGDQRPFEGAHYQLQRPLNNPQNITRPHPPIMIGGGGEKKTLRLVAKYADACNLYPGPDLPAKLDVLRAHCVDEGRDYDAIEKTVIFPFDVGPDGAGAADLVTHLRSLAEAGVQTALGIVSGPDPVRQVELIGKKVVPAVADA
ncbi:LLM class F420-dependent oxidoreductase [Sphaerisporangium sp. TRM90804]|uniref:LLM class F420-dependent oxidoreductase n=1 Tax=Sphaerisporangium sp. TRM90804 TaxID=3031113 RepID=UPI0024471455|nr:LLM class F420-dependent oxidoreductase [Sphaerisporangium sp. TRM90804]MDH2424510.1 LLM class F420-dependent oxidoreductase [Sphaerisporangium sp. TRM90804]